MIRDKSALRIEPIGTRVRLDRGLGTGTIMAHTIACRPSESHTEQVHLWYLIELDDGFYQEGRENFVSILVVHADSVHELLDEWLAEDR